MKILKLLLILFLLSFGCKEQPEPKDQIETNKPTVTQNTDLFYHYSIWYAFVNKVF